MTTKRKLLSLVLTIAVVLNFSFITVAFQNESHAASTSKIQFKVLDVYGNVIKNPTYIASNSAGDTYSDSDVFYSNPDENGTVTVNQNGNNNVFANNSIVIKCEKQGYTVTPENHTFQIDSNGSVTSIDDSDAGRADVPVFVFKPNDVKTHLSNTITSDEMRYTEGTYTAESWSKYETTLSKAKKVVQSDSSSDNAIIQVEIALNTAAAQLVKENSISSQDAFKAKVVDESGNPMSGVRFQLKYTDPYYEYANKTLEMTSDAQGGISVNISEFGTTYGDYYLTVADPSYSIASDNDNLKVTVGRNDEFVDYTYYISSINGVNLKYNTVKTVIKLHKKTALDSAKADLQESIDQAEAKIKDKTSEDYLTGYSELKEEISTAKNMIETATNVDDVKPETEKLNACISSLVEYKEVEGSTFYALVVDEDNHLLGNVAFTVKGNKLNREFTSKDGVLKIAADTFNGDGTVTVALKTNDQYICSETHSFEVKDSFIVNVDGNQFNQWSSPAVKLVYHLKKYDPDAADKSAAKSVTDQINKLPDTLSLENKEAVDSANTAFSNLTDAQKKFISEETKIKLQQAVSKIKELQDKADQEAANAVIAKIDAIPEESAMTLADETTVTGAKAAYDNLTEVQKAKVAAEKVSKLENAEKKIAALKKEAQKNVEDKKAADNVKAQISGLPAADKLALADRNSVEKVREAYNALTADQKKLVDNLDTLTAAEAKIAELQKAAAEKEIADTKAANDVKTLINAIPSADAIQLTDQAQIAAAREAYNALTNDQKAKIDAETLQKLTAAEKKIQDLQAADQKQKADKKAADAVEQKINALPSADALTLADQNAVNDAKTSYDSLTSDQKKLVSETSVNKLQNALKKIQELQPNTPSVPATPTQPSTDEVKTLKTDLQKLMNNASSVNTTSKYTKKSVEALKAAYEEAEKVISNPNATADELKAAKDKLNHAVDALTAAPKVSKTKLTAKGKKKAVNLKWNKLKKITGYKIYFASKRNGKYKLVKVVKKPTQTKLTVTKLKKGHKYFFKMKGYKKVDGETFYGSFSNIAAATVK